MPNVRIAGAYCIMKISTLFIGVRALLKLGMVEQLCEMRNDTINDIKTYAVQTLYNVCNPQCITQVNLLLLVTKLIFCPTNNNTSRFSAMHQVQPYQTLNHFWMT